LIREHDKLVQLGVVSTADISNKDLVTWKKDKSNNPKKQYSHHNSKKNKGHKLSHPTFDPNGDKGTQSKIKNIV
jgi:hypothetical protein